MSNRPPMKVYRSTDATIVARYKKFRDDSENWAERVAAAAEDLGCRDKSFMVSSGHRGLVLTGFTGIPDVIPEGWRVKKAGRYSPHDKLVPDGRTKAGKKAEKDFQDRGLWCGPDSWSLHDSFGIPHEAEGEYTADGAQMMHFPGIQWSRDGAEVEVTWGTLNVSIDDPRWHEVPIPQWHAEREDRP